MNSVERKSPSITTSSINKLFKRLVKKCFGNNFFKLTHSLKKSMACVNITKL
jgi:hypothetical protein